MKKLSFKALEQEILKNGLLLNEENLRNISGGKIALQEHNPAGIVADPFTNTDTTIVQEGALSQNVAMSHSAGSVAQSFVHQNMMAPMGQTEPFTTQGQTAIDPAQQTLNNLITANFTLPPGVTMSTATPTGFLIDQSGVFYKWVTGPNGQPTKDYASGVSVLNTDGSIVSYISPGFLDALSDSTPVIFSGNCNWNNRTRIRIRNESNYFA